MSAVIKCDVLDFEDPIIRHSSSSTDGYFPSQLDERRNFLPVYFILVRHHVNAAHGKAIPSNDSTTDNNSRQIIRVNL